jgi:hypothetical protein
MTPILAVREPDDSEWMYACGAFGVDAKWRPSLCDVPTQMIEDLIIREPI